MTAEGRAAAKRAEQLIENVLTALNAVDPGGIMVAIGDDWPERESEQLIEAEEIARRIRRQESGGAWLSERKVAKIVRSVIEEAYSQRPPRREARRAAGRICRGRVSDLVAEVVAEEGAAPLAEGRAALLRHDDGGGFPVVELNPERSTAAGLTISVDYAEQVTCSVADRYSHEIFSAAPAEIADELHGLVAALVSGTYYEEQRNERRGLATKAIWPAGGSSSLDLVHDPSRLPTEWRKRAYDPY